MVTKEHGNPIHKNVLDRDIDPLYFQGYETRKQNINVEKESKVLQLRLNLIKSITEASELFDCLDTQDLSQYASIKRDSEAILASKSRLGSLFIALPFGVLALYRYKTNGAAFTQTFIRDAYLYTGISLGLVGGYSLLNSSKLRSLEAQGKDIEAIYYALSLMHSIRLSNYKEIRFYNLDKVYY